MVVVLLLRRGTAILMVLLSAFRFTQGNSFWLCLLVIQLFNLQRNFLWKQCQFGPNPWESLIPWRGFLLVLSPAVFQLYHQENPTQRWTYFDLTIIYYHPVIYVKQIQKLTYKEGTQLWGDPACLGLGWDTRIYIIFFIIIISKCPCFVVTSVRLRTEDRTEQFQLFDRSECPFLYINMHLKMSRAICQTGICECEWHQDQDHHEKARIEWLCGCFIKTMENPDLYNIYDH